MAKDRIVKAIAERQALFPENLVRALEWTKLDGRSLEETLARMSTIFPPVFLPLFEFEGDVFAEHLWPGRNRQDSGWFRLPHDDTDPLLVASKLLYLPRRLPRPPHCMPRQVHAVWTAASAMAALIGSSPLPPEAEYAERQGGDLSDFNAKLDPTDGASRVTAAVNQVPRSDEPQARQVVERLLASTLDDHHVAAAVAMARVSIGDASATDLARRVFEAEITHGFPIPSRHIVSKLGSLVAVLEGMRSILASATGDMDVLEPLRGECLNEEAGTIAFRSVAQALVTKSGDARSLAFLRNSAWASGAFAQIGRSFCEEIADLSTRVERGGLSADVASLAASVISRGP